MKFLIKNLKIVYKVQKTELIYPQNQEILGIFVRN